MVYPWSPEKVVALVLEGMAAIGEIDAEFAAYAQDEGGPLVVNGPPGPLVACGVNAPLYFYGPARPDALGEVDEVPEDPAMPLTPVFLGVSAVPAPIQRRPSGRRLPLFG